MTLQVGDRVHVSFGPPSPGWMSGEIVKLHLEALLAWVRWDANQKTEWIEFERISVVARRSAT